MKVNLKGEKKKKKSKGKKILEKIKREKFNEGRPEEKVAMFWKEIERKYDEK